MFYYCSVVFSRHEATLYRVYRVYRRYDAMTVGLSVRVRPFIINPISPSVCPFSLLIGLLGTALFVILYFVPSLSVVQRLAMRLRRCCTESL